MQLSDKAPTVSSLISRAVEKKKRWPWPLIPEGVYVHACMFSPDKVFLVRLTYPESFYILNSNSVASFFPLTCPVGLHSTNVYMHTQAKGPWK